MELITERLILRNYRESDFDAYWQYVSSDKVGPMCGWPSYTDKQKAKERLNIEIAKEHQFAIYHKEAKKVIGSIEVMDCKIERFPELAGKNVKEIGFMLSEEFWGQGIMPEALNAVIKFVFENLKLNEIVICHAEANIQSGKVQE